MYESKKEERKKEVGWLNVLCDPPIVVFSDRVSVACRTRAYRHTDTQIHTHTHLSHILPPQRVAWLTAFGLTLLLLAAPAYSYGSIIARYRETYLEAFACRERATISFYLSPLLPLT